MFVTAVDQTQFIWHFFPLLRNVCIYVGLRWFSLVFIGNETIILLSFAVKTHHGFLSVSLSSTFICFIWIVYLTYCIYIKKNLIFCGGVRHITEQKYKRSSSSQVLFATVAICEFVSLCVWEFVLCQSFVFTVINLSGVGHKLLVVWHYSYSYSFYYSPKDADQEHQMYQKYQEPRPGPRNQERCVSSRFSRLSTVDSRALGYKVMLRLLTFIPWMFHDLREGSPERFIYEQDFSSNNCVLFFQHGFVSSNLLFYFFIYSFNLRRISTRTWYLEYFFFRMFTEGFSFKSWWFMKL